MSGKRDHLVFVRGGKTSLHHDWLKGPGPRSWDLQVSQWIDDPDIGADGGNVGLLDGSVRWKSIDQMQKYRGSQLWGEDGAFTVW